MGLFDFFKRKKVTPPPAEQTSPLSPVKEENPPERVSFRRTAFARPIEVNSSNASLLQSKFIAFDVETTGLNSDVNRIIEVGAVLFIDGEPTKMFSSLVNPGIRIPSSATAINHITNAMIDSAPTEQEMYPAFIDFLLDAISGDTVMCAHNAKFDFSFLCETLSRLGYDANFRYIDTLSLSRRCVKGLKNYKQQTLEQFFGLVNDNAHRAVSDAENCGKILYELLDLATQEPEDISCNEYDDSDDEGYKLWSQGEDARINGEVEKALELFDKARDAGYTYPAIYMSYAKAFRKLKAYEREISILEEGLMHIDKYKVADFESRRDRARELLNAKNEKEADAQQRALEREEKKSLRQREREFEAARPKQPIGRSIVQCTDDGTVVKVYETISSAAKETGVSSKCIRDAACGKQKHAAGFCWRYADQ